jgi:hypothetical protein
LVIGVLKDISGPLTHGVEVFFLHTILAKGPNATAGWSQQANQDVEEGAFPCAIGAGDRQSFGGVELKAGSLQDAGVSGVGKMQV